MKFYMEASTDKEKEIIGKYLGLFENELREDTAANYISELLEQGDRAEVIDGDMKMVITKGEKWSLDMEFGPEQVVKMENLITTLKEVADENPDIISELKLIVTDYMSGLKFYLMARLLEKKMYGRYAGLYKKVRNVFADYLKAA